MNSTIKNEISEMESLLQRIDEAHLRKRLSIQVGVVVRLLGRGTGRFHFENFDFAMILLKCFLKAIGFYRRGYRNFKNIQIIHNSVKLPRLPEKFDGYTILHLSDLHLDMDPVITDIIIDRVSELSFDLCVITGDYRFRTHGIYGKSVEEVRKLRPYLDCEHGVFGILGNHDFIEFVPAFEKMGVRMLMNESAELIRSGQSIWLAGVDDPHFYGTHDLARASQDIPAAATKIILAHTQDLYQRAANAGFDLYLAGHTHGGQICLPGEIPILAHAACPRRILKKAWRFQRMQGYTSCGTGSSGLPVRFNCLPEIILHHLAR
ncbi:metallophosphoesterase family protein [candidate division KSB1 bacterium]|nr:metallophosphoesterase family protein [candidate division KSB1 bacterium]